MPQDYVKRTKAKPKTRATAHSKKTQNQPVSAMAIAGIILTVTLVAGFIYFLNSIKGRGDTSTPVEKTTVTTTPTPKVEETVLPPPPKDKWDYPDELSDPDEVAVEDFDVEQKGPYQMQCGSFRTSDQAESLKAKIAFVGIESMVKRTEGTNGIWYKVVLGPYERKRLAEADRHKLKSNGINYCRIWLWT